MSAPHRYAARVHGSYFELDLGDRVLRLPDTQPYTDPDNWASLASPWLADRLQVLLGEHEAEVLDEVLPLHSGVLAGLVDALAVAIGVQHIDRLAFLLQRYGDAIDADLAHEYPGRSVNEIFSGHATPDEITNLIARLPRTSRLAEAMQNDTELAERMADTELAETTTDAETRAGARFTEFSPEVAAISHAVVALNWIVEFLSGMGSGPPTRLPHPKTPVSASDRLAEKRSDEEVDLLLDEVAAATAAWHELHSTTDDPEEV